LALSFAPTDVRQLGDGGPLQFARLLELTAPTRQPSVSPLLECSPFVRGALSVILGLA
jgi:hypothetical protein